MITAAAIWPGLGPFVVPLLDPDTEGLLLVCPGDDEVNVGEPIGLVGLDGMGLLGPGGPKMAS